MIAWPLPPEEWPPLPIPPAGYPPFGFTKALVPLHLLELDEEYHRPANAHLRQSMGPLQPRLFGRLLINNRGDERYWLVDGLTRAYLAHEAGYSEVPAHVFGVDRATEARYFIEMNDNNRNRVTAVEKFRALLVANDPVALALYNAMRDAGYRLELFGTLGGPDVTGAVGTLLQLAEDSEAGARSVGVTLALMQATWPGVEGNGRAEFIRAVHRVRSQAQGVLEPAELDHLFTETFTPRYTSPNRLLTLARLQHSDRVTVPGSSESYDVRPTQYKALTQVMIQMLNEGIDVDVYPKKSRRAIPLLY